MSDVKVVMNLSKNLRALMERRSWNISTLAKQAGVPKQSISDWVSAGRSPRNLTDLKKVGLALNTTIDDLLFGDVSEKSRNAAKGSTDKRGTQMLDAIMGGDEVSGVFKVTIKRLPDKE